MFKPNKKRAFSLLEIILAVAIFSGMAISVGYLIIDASKTTEMNSKKIGALFYAKECLEAVRSIRDNSGFSELEDNVENNVGLTYDSVNNSWSFNNNFAGDSLENGLYIRSVNIDIDPLLPNIAETTCTINASGAGRDFSVSLVTQFTNWLVE